VSAALLLTVLAVSGCSDSKPKTVEPPSIPAAVATSGPGTGDLFVYGTVTRGDRPVEGAAITVALVPNGGIQDAGETEELYTPPEARSDSRGRWAVRVDPSKVPGKYFNHAHTFVNFDIMIRRPKELTHWAAVLWLTKDPAVWRTDDSAPGDGLFRLDFDLQAGRVIQTNSQGESERFRTVTMATD
jgi:hypothetical protein